MKFLFLPLGILFGFLLSRAGATTYDFYAELFLFKDLQLMYVIGTAAAVGFVGIQIMRRFVKKALVTGDTLKFEGKPMVKTLVAGSLIFGVGWGVAGACPGTALAMLGEGKGSALFTIAGIALGTYIYGVVKDGRGMDAGAVTPADPMAAGS